MSLIVGGSRFVVADSNSLADNWVDNWVDNWAGNWAGNWVGNWVVEGSCIVFGGCSSLIAVPGNSSLTGNSDICDSTLEAPFRIVDSVNVD